MPSTGARWRVAELLGEGGQGAVFRIVPLTGAAPARALKWYPQHSAHPEQRQAIRHLARRGAPGPDYLWPEEVIDGPAGTFGYTMPLRPPEFRPFSDVLTGRAATSLSLRLLLGANLAHAFLQLHAEGLCYRDISFGNVFVHPGDGAVLICDNDNVGVDGQSDSQVLGTRRFMAPEVVRRQALPSASTDLHSLAVLIFYLLVFHHPLCGARELSLRGREGESVLLGTDPVFIFDPHDPRNRPDPVQQPGPTLRWEHCPTAVQRLFDTAFGPGLHDPGRRVRESVWRSTLDRAVDDIVVCPHCQQHQPAHGGALAGCALCGHQFDDLIVLDCAGRRLVLNADTAITAHHVLRNHDRHSVWGRVVHDGLRDRWGIENTSPHPWRLLTASGTAHVVNPGQRTALIAGSQLMIGARRFTIDAAHTISS